MNPILIVLFIAFYFQGNIAGLIGLDKGHIVYTLLVLCLWMLFRKRNEEGLKVSSGLFVLIGVVCMLLYRQYAGMFSGSFISAMFVLLPAFLIYILPDNWQTEEHQELKCRIVDFIYHFYVLECLIAIVELITHHYIFGYSEASYGDGQWHFTSSSDDFRSVSICGSPLSNSLIVLTINSFILFSSMPRNRKIFCCVIGLLAMFGFNARISIILYCLSIALFYFKRHFQMSFWKLVAALMGLAAAFLGLFILISQLGLGSRFADTDVENDGSIAVRLKLFEYFGEASLTDYLMGFSMIDVENEMEEIGVAVIENFWIGFMMLFGLIPLIYFTICYFLYGKSLFQGYKKYDKIVISLLFIINASINNSLYSSYAPLFIFLICAVAFNESNGALEPVCEENTDGDVN